MARDTKKTKAVAKMAADRSGTDRSEIDQSGSFAAAQDFEPFRAILGSGDTAFLDRLRQEIPLCFFLAEAAGATARQHGVITVDAYQALAQTADELDALTPYPGLMRVLTLHAVTSETSYKGALTRLHKEAENLTREERAHILRAMMPVMTLHGDTSREHLSDWSQALTCESSLADTLRQQLPAPENSSRGLVARLMERFTGTNTDTALDSKIKKMAWVLRDDQLQTFADEVAHAAEGDLSPATLRKELDAAAQRAFERSASLLKSPAVLEEQTVVAERFMEIIETLVTQLRQRLASIHERLQFQSEMYHEDVNRFIETCLERVEASLSDVMDDRSDWSDPTLWKQFSEHTVYRNILAEFQPLKTRYDRHFQQWNKEYEAFANEVETVRSGVMQNIDPRSFSNLLSTHNTLATVKNRLDRLTSVALGLGATGTAATLGGFILDSTLTATMLGGVGTAVGTVGIASGAAVLGGSALWKFWSKPKARKRQIIISKREKIKKQLEKMLAEEALDHDRQAEEIFQKFTEAAGRQYAPLVSSARLAVMKARLETKAIRRVLDDTRRVAELTGAKHG